MRRRRRIIWTDSLRNEVGRLKLLGLTHQEIAKQMGFTLCQVYWGWKLYKEKTPLREYKSSIDDRFIEKISKLRKRGLYRREIALKLGVSISHIDRAIFLGKTRGFDVALNARIYSARQRHCAFRAYLR